MWRPASSPNGRPLVGPRGHTGRQAPDARLQPTTNVSPEVSALVRALIRVRNRRHGEAGQSLVEFSLIILPLFVIVLGIIQFGLIFNTYVTMTNAARDAARHGTIYVYTRESGETQATNDLARNESIKIPGPGVDEHAGQDGALLHDRVDLDPERPDLHERRPGHHLLPADRRHRTARRGPARRSPSGRRTTRT